MKERPILFSGPMVRALLSGKKTQTRRAVKAEHLRTSEDPWKVLQVLPERAMSDVISLCRYGQAGDRLWVKETFCPVVKPVDDGRRYEPAGFVYRATHEGTGYDGSWKPSIFCSRKASRITLEIDRVRVEALRSISVEDALREGIQHNTMADPRAEFQQLWESINGEFSWSLNTWVWVLEFHVCEKPSAS